MNRLIKYLLLFWCCFCLVSFAISRTPKQVYPSVKQKTSVKQRYSGTNLRGRVFNAYNKSPLIGAQVDLVYLDPNYRKERIIVSAYTDKAGYYYFKNVIPNSYSVRINGSRTFTIKVREIDYNYSQYQDLSTYYYK